MPSLLPILIADAPNPSAPSLYMPDVRVEIAFNAGVRTASSLYTWTDVSAYVELDQGITITGGRSDERSVADANQLSLTLDNRDGRFTAGLSTSPYYPYVKLNRPIRVTFDPVDGFESAQFTGFINEWPVEWADGTDASAYARVTASSRLSRLGLQANLKSIIEQAILADSPVAYYTLGEPAGATQANDSSGQRAAALQVQPLNPVTFGSATGPGTDGLTAASFSYSSAAIPTVPTLRSALDLATANVTIECAFLIDSATHPAIVHLLSIGTTTGTWVDIEIDGGISTGTLKASSPSSSITAATTLTVGATHHVALVMSGSSWTLYGDGVSVASGVVSALATGSNDLMVGGSLSATGFYADGSWVEAHVAVFNSALTAAQVAAHSSAALTGYAGDTTDARLIRYGGYAGIAAADINAETGQTTMQHVDTTDKQVVELMRVCETTEGGVLFDGRDGRTNFQNRAHRYTLARSQALDMAEGEVEAGYLPKYDRTGLLNDISAQDTSGRYTAHVFDTTSVNDHGQSTASIETASQDDDAPLFQASWMLYTNKDPKERAPTLEVDVLAQVGKVPNSANVLAITMGDKITVFNRPVQAASSSIDYFIEGWTLTAGHEYLHMSFNLSPSAPYDQVLVVDDPVRGKVDTYPVAF